MATEGAPATACATELDHQRQRRTCLRALGDPGWMHRLSPLSRFMACQRLIRARSNRGGALASVDAATLQSSPVTAPGAIRHVALTVS
jgi:hypothetical protein